MGNGSASRQSPVRCWSSLVTTSDRGQSDDGPVVTDPRLILIVGLQKSGTTLLARLIQDAAGFPRLFGPEGDDFWGNVPPFSPTAFPAGLLYQSHGGWRGHELCADEASADVRATMMARFRALADRAGNVP